MSRNSLYQATFAQRSPPVSPMANGCCGPIGATHESVVMELTATRNRREFEIRSLMQRNKALSAMIQNQGPIHSSSRMSTSTYGILPHHFVDMRDDVYQHSTREEEHRNHSLDGTGDLQSKKDKMIESLKQEKAKMKEKSIALEETKKALSDEIAMYKKMLQTSKILAEGQKHIHEENDHAVSDLKEKNADLWKKWKKESYNVKCKDTLLAMQRQRLEEQENLIKNYEKKFPSGIVDIPKRALFHGIYSPFLCRYCLVAHICAYSHVHNISVLDRIDESERLWSKISMREINFKDRKITIGNQREEIAILNVEKEKLQDEVDQMRKCFASLQLKLRETGDKIDMVWLLSKLREKARLKERNDELEEIIVGKGYTVKAADAEIDLRKREVELATEIKEYDAVMENLRGYAKDVDNIELTELLDKLQVALLVLGPEKETSKRVGVIVHDNEILKGRVAELEEIIRGQGYTVKAAAAEHDLRAKEIDLADKVKTITDVLEALNNVIDGVDNTEVAVLLRRLEDVLMKFRYDRECSSDIFTQHSMISDVGWNLGCVTFEPDDYAELAIGQSDSTVMTARSSSSVRSDDAWTQLLQLDTTK